MRTENLAVMFTDIKGFTERTGRQTRAENERLLKIHEMLLVPTFRAFGGTVRKTIGDAFLVTFPSPTNAVLCAAAVQDRLYVFNRGAKESDRLEIRVAINIGEVRVKQNDVFGEPVNIAARVEGLTDANEIYFTEAVHLAMNKAEAPCEEVGTFELKGVAEKVRVFRVPHGPYRVTAEHPPDKNVPASDLPYGGIGIGRAPHLPLPDAAAIDRALAAQKSPREAMASLRDRVILATRSDGLLPTRPFALLRELLASPGLRWLKPAGVSALVLLVAGLAAVGVWRMRTPPVERLLSSGKWKEARALVDALPEGCERSYWKGRFAQTQGRWEGAIDEYRDAGSVKEWRRRAIDRLDEIAKDGDCDAKQRVARAVRDLGDAYGIFVLDRLAKEKPVRRTGVRGFLGIDCDPAKAAEAARAALTAK